MKKKAVITLIASVAKNGVIGKGGSQPLYLKEDLKRFKQLTLNNVVIMGRKTYEAIVQKTGKPLPERINIVLSSDASFKAPGCIVVGSIPAALKEAEKTEKQIFIIGGQQVFSQTIALANRLEITEIQQDLEGDAFFPEIRKNEWRETGREKKEENGVLFDFVGYERNPGNKPVLKAIVFDMGGVALAGRLEDIFARVGKKLGIPAGLFRELEKDYKEKAIVGKISHRGFIELLKEKAKLSQSVDEILSIWKNAYLEVMPINKELVEEAKKLKKKYKVAMISNINDFHAKINTERGLFTPFEPCLLSCEVGIAKPDKRIFEIVLQKLGLPAEECLLIDDREEHLSAPKELGFKTILFKNNKQLFEDLKKMGIEN